MTLADVPAAELSDLRADLQDDGHSGLLWAALPRNLRHAALGRALRRGAMADAAAAARLDGHLVNILSALTRAGVAPIVTKGWAVSRYYPNPAMRPYADLDLAVHPDQADRTRQTLSRLGDTAVLVDLHVGLPDLPDRSWSEVFARSRLADLNGYPVRVLAPEDQFRWLTAHLVRHVCHRPLWLIDIATMVEQVEPVMDWELCLRGSFAWRRWMLAVVAMAERLLGARVPASLTSRVGGMAPDWLQTSTLWRWGGGSRMAFRQLRRHPSEWWPFVAYRLLNPVRWAFRTGLPPLRFVPPIWAIGVVGKMIQPGPKLWRRWIAPCKPDHLYTVHTRRLF
jgi:hypothetical protein